jgi:pyruvate formate lyase activating enzyme
MKATCPICPRHCRLEEGETGFCRARVNVKGAVIAQNYGRLTALALDPIEKKPLARYYPGSYILSAGSYGCNMRCPFCQNCGISMTDENVPFEYVACDVLAEKALELKPQGNIGIAFTYNEPLVGYEFVRDCAVEAHKRALKTVVVTNGYICEEPLKNLLAHIDAMNIDLKGFTREWYARLGGDLETVKSSIRAASERCHVEITTLIVNGENDSVEEMKLLAQWLASVDKNIALHITRFFPNYRMTDRPATPVKTIGRL